MADIKLKRGTGVPPSLEEGEPAVDTSTGRMYVGTESGVSEVGSNVASGDFTGDLKVDGTLTVNTVITADDGEVNVSGDLGVNGDINATGGIEAEADITAPNLNISNWDEAYDGSVKEFNWGVNTGKLDLILGSGWPLEDSTKSVQLDGRYLQYHLGLFTPKVTDGSATASASTEKGIYFLVHTGDPNNPVAAYMRILFNGINKAGLNNNNDLVIKNIPAFLRPSTVDQYDSVLHGITGFKAISEDSNWSTTSQNFDEFKIVSYTRGGGVIIKIDDIDNPANSISTDFFFVCQ